MNRQPTGDSSTGMIIPVDPSGGSSSRLFPHILDAISQIQQFLRDRGIRPGNPG